MHRLAFREEVTFHDEEPPYVHDRLLDRRVELGGKARIVARLIDGTRTVAEVRRDALAAGVEPARCDRSLRLFQLLNLVVGAGDEVMARVARLRRGEERLPHAVLEGARFACQGSGECCQNYWLGPLTADDVARLDALDPTKVPYAGEPPYWQVREDGGVAMRFLRTRDERCVFLLDDNRCGIHATFGAHVKPGLCNTYPFEQLATIDGVKLYDKGACASFAVSARRGLPVADELPKMIPLLGERHQLHHPIVHVDDGVVCDYGHWLAFTRALTAMAARPMAESGHTATEVVRAAGRATRRFTDALAACPIGRGEPDATVAAVTAEIAAADAALFAPPVDLDEARRASAAALADLAGDLLGAASSTIMRRHRAGQGPLSTRLAREAAQLFHLVQAVAAHAADPGAPLLAWYAEVIARPFGDDDVDEVLRLSLRQQLFAVRNLLDDRAGPGLLRLAVIHAVAVVGAKLRAALDGREAVRAEDLSYGHMLAVRTVDSTAAGAALVSRADAVHAILEGLPHLIPWRAR